MRATNKPLRYVVYLSPSADGIIINHLKHFALGKRRAAEMRRLLEKAIRIEKESRGTHD